MSLPPLIETQAHVDAGAAWLAARSPAFAAALARVGPLPLRRRPDGFAALLQVIVGQQVSIASADAIWRRLEAAALTGEAAIGRATPEALRAAGLSRQKVRYAKALAEARIDYAALRRAGDAEVIRTLTAVPGIGVWTAEIYAMFSLGRRDVFAAGDLALQEAARFVLDLPQRPREAQLRALARDWSPWRAVAARLLFTCYRHEKGREGVVTGGD